MSEPAVLVADNPAASRYEIRVGDQLAGFAAYRTEPNRIIVTHTEIDPTFKGRGLGNRLAAGTLDDLRRRHLAVTPQCPFMAKYIDEHPDYADLVAPISGTTT
ncbi:MAG TPA: GNAT family N-acetyltransferase [Acidimicrobiia bacterium]